MAMLNNQRLYKIHSNPIGIIDRKKHICIDVPTIILDNIIQLILYPHNLYVFIIPFGHQTGK